TTDRVESLAAQDTRAAAIERGVVPIFTGLDDTEEQLLLLPARALLPLDAMLERIEVVEILRALHRGNRGIGKEADCFFNQFRRSHVVRVQRDDELAVGMLQGMVKVSCFGMRTVRTNQVGTAKFLGKLADLGTLPVVENVRLMRIFHVDGAQ